MRKAITFWLFSEGLAAMDYFRVLAQMLQGQGRGNDTLLAHITPEEARLLKRRGGSGTRNPVTGLLEFYDSEGSSPDGSSSTSDSGGGGNDSGGGWGGGDWGSSTQYSGWDGWGQSVDSRMDLSQPAPAITDEVAVSAPPGFALGAVDSMMDVGRPAPAITDEVTVTTHPSHVDFASSGGYNNDGGNDSYYALPAAPPAPAPPPRQFGVDPAFLAQLARARNIGVPVVTPFTAYGGPSFVPPVMQAPDLLRRGFVPVSMPSGSPYGGYLDASSLMTDVIGGGRFGGGR